MHPAITSFLSEPDLVKVDPAGDLAREFLILDRAAIYNRHARGFAGAVALIMLQPWSVAEKVGVVCELIEYGKSRAGSEVLITRRLIEDFYLTVRNQQSSNGAPACEDSAAGDDMNAAENSK